MYCLMRSTCNLCKRCPELCAKIMRRKVVSSSYCSGIIYIAYHSCSVQLHIWDICRSHKQSVSIRRLSFKRLTPFVIFRVLSVQSDTWGYLKYFLAEGTSIILPVSSFSFRSIISHSFLTFNRLGYSSCRSGLYPGIRLNVLRYLAHP